MAANYEILSSVPSVEIIGPTETRDIQRVTVRALPSGVVFPISVPPILNNPTAINDLAGVQADWVNQYAAVPGVVGIVVIQDVDAAGQLDDIQIATVSSTSGNSTAEARDSFARPSQEDFRNGVEVVRRNLDEIEAL